MSFAEELQKDRRLVILRALADESDYSMNESNIQICLKMFGHGKPRDVIKADIAWLEEQSLVTVKNLMDRIMVATITQRGQEVAEGVTVHPGVKRPGPG